MARVHQIAKFTADGTEARREFDKTGDAGERMSKRIREGAQSMGPALRAVDAGAGVAKQKLDGMASSAGSAGTVLRAIGPIGFAVAAGIGAAVVAFNAMNTASRAATDTLGEIYTAAQRLNVSVEFLQEFRYAMVQTGEDARIVDASLQRFAVKLGEVRTGLGEDAVRAFQALGFTRDQVENFEDIQELLPEVADRLANLSSTAERAAIAEKLGLREMLPLLQQGGEAIERTREQARQLGIVLDEETVRRAYDLGGAWDAAAYALDITLKQAMVDAAPLFIETLRFLREMAQAASDFVDQFQAVEDRSTRFLRQQLTANSRRQLELSSQFAGESLEGGDARRGEAFSNLSGALGRPQNQTLREARNEIAYLRERAQALVDELNSRADSVTLPGNNGDGSALGLGAPNRPDADIQRLRQFIATLEDEAEARERLAAVQREYPKAANDELDARAELLERMQQLDEARARGVISSDEELARLRGLAQASFDAAEAERAHAAAIREREQLQRNVDQFLRSVETPLERLRREEEELYKLRRQAAAEGIGLSDEAFARGVERIQDAYREIAAAQFEASLAGQILQGVWDGQIKSLEDIETLLLRIAGDAVLRELLSGGVFAGGGFGGFASRVLDRIGTSITGNDESNWGRVIGGASEAAAEQVEALATAGGEAAKAMAAELAPSVGDAAAKILISTGATTAEATATNATTASMVVLTKAAASAAAALAQIAAAEGGENIVSSITSAFSKGGGKAGGGKLSLYRRHEFAEGDRPELLLIGGQGEAFPNDAVEGLRLLAGAARRAQSAPASGGGGGVAQVGVSLRNESGVALEASEATASLGPDGALDVQVLLRRSMAKEIADGNLNGVMGAQFGAKPRRVRR